MDLAEMIKERKAKVKNLDPYEVGSMFSNMGQDYMKQGFESQMAQGNPFQVGSTELLGGRASDIYNQRLSGLKNSILRNAVFADAQRQSVTGDLVAQERLKQEQRLIEEAQKRAARKARKKGLMGALGGLAGAGLGALLAPTGMGMAGAYIGQGAGSLISGGR